MKTILFIDKGDKQLWESFLEHGHLFEEVLQEGDLTVCDWRGSGTSVRASVPELPAALGDEDEWRAIVACDLRGAKGTLRPVDDRFFENPFDFPENYSVSSDTPVRESFRPVVRLSQMLGGLPDRVSLREASGGVNRFEIVHPRAQEHFEILERYRLGVVRPTRLMAVTPRDVDEGVLRELAGRRIRDDRTEARRFWERNGYSAITRFVVCDFTKGAMREDEDDPHVSAKEIAAEHAIGRWQWFQFWLSVLILSQAELSGDDLRPYDLYRLETEIDRDTFDRALSSKKGTWEAARDVLATRISLEQGLLSRTEYQVADVPDCSTHIPIEFDLVRNDRLQANPEVVGTFRDVPVNDLQQWGSEWGQSMETLRDLMYAPRRGVRNGVVAFHHSNTLPAAQLEYCILNAYENERLVDELEKEEVRLVRELNPDPFSGVRASAPLDALDASVRASIGRRSPRRPILVVIGVAVASLVMSAVFLVADPAKNAYDRSVALFGTLVCCAILCCVGYLTIRHQMRAVRQAYKGYNKSILEVFDNMYSDVEGIGHRLSSFATLSKRWAVYDRQCGRGLPTERLVWLRERQARIKKRLDQLDGIASGHVDIDRNAYRQVMSRGWEALRDALDDDYYYLPYVTRTVRRPLNREMHLGKEIDVPFAFVSGVSLRRQALYEYGDVATRPEEVVDG